MNTKTSRPTEYELPASNELQQRQTFWQWLCTRYRRKPLSIVQLRVEAVHVTELDLHDAELKREAARYEVARYDVLIEQLQLRLHRLSTAPEPLSTHQVR